VLPAGGMHTRAQPRRTFGDASTGGAPSPGKRTRTGAIRGGGGLPDDALARMNDAFGADFAHVRVREDAALPALGLRAEASGDELTLAPGELETDRAAGWPLIAHELTHVAQQRGGRVVGDGLVDDAALEREADAVGACVAAGGPAGIAPPAAGAASIARQPKKQPGAAATTRLAFGGKRGAPLIKRVTLDAPGGGEIAIAAAVTMSGDVARPEGLDDDAVRDQVATTGVTIASALSEAVTITIGGAPASVTLPGDAFAQPAPYEVTMEVPAAAVAVDFARGITGEPDVGLAVTLRFTPGQAGNPVDGRLPEFGLSLGNQKIKKQRAGDARAVQQTFKKHQTLPLTTAVDLDPGRLSITGQLGLSGAGRVPTEDAQLEDLLTPERCATATVDGGHVTVQLGRQGGDVRKAGGKIVLRPAERLRQPRADVRATATVAAESGPLDFGMVHFEGAWRAELALGFAAVDGASGSLPRREDLTVTCKGAGVDWSVGGTHTLGRARTFEAGEHDLEGEAAPDALEDAGLDEDEVPDDLRVNDVETEAATNADAAGVRVRAQASLRILGATVRAPDPERARKDAVIAAIEASLDDALARLEPELHADGVAFTTPIGGRTLSLVIGAEAMRSSNAFLVQNGFGLGTGKQDRTLQLGDLTLENTSGSLRVSAHVQPTGGEARQIAADQVALSWGEKAARFVAGKGKGQEATGSVTDLAALAAVKTLAERLPATERRHFEPDPSRFLSYMLPVFGGSVDLLLDHYAKIRTVKDHACWLHDDAATRLEAASAAYKQRHDNADPPKVKVGFALRNIPETGVGKWGMKHKLGLALDLSSSRNPMLHDVRQEALIWAVTGDKARTEGGLAKAKAQLARDADGHVNEQKVEEVMGELDRLQQASDDFKAESLGGLAGDYQVAADAYGRFLEAGGGDRAAWLKFVANDAAAKPAWDNVEVRLVTPLRTEVRSKRDANTDPFQCNARGTPATVSWDELLACLDDPEWVLGRGADGKRQYDGSLGRSGCPSLLQLRGDGFMNAGGSFQRPFIEELVRAGFVPGAAFADYHHFQLETAEPNPDCPEPQD
jgi:hypothetical protein